MSELNANANEFVPIKKVRFYDFKFIPSDIVTTNNVLTKNDVTTFIKNNTYLFEPSIKECKYLLNSFSKMDIEKESQLLKKRKFDEM